jgi:hypothetical protein
MTRKEEMTTEPVNAVAENLFEQWTNGNRKDVLRALTSMSSMRAACVASQVVMLLAYRDEEETGAHDFIRAMERRLEG